MKSLVELLDESSLISDMYHNAKGSILVYVLKTKDGPKPYEYPHCTSEVYATLVSATLLTQSPGQVFNAFKKDYANLMNQD